MVGVAILLLLIGLAVAIAEVLFPSFGLFTVISAACVIGSVAAGFESSTAAGVTFIIAAFVLVPLSVAFGFRLLRTSRFGNRILLGAPDTPTQVDAIYKDNQQLLGRHGVAITALRPAGTVEIDGERFPVVTEGDLLNSGETVKIVIVEGNRIVVRPVGADWAPPPPTANRPEST